MPTSPASVTAGSMPNTSAVFYGKPKPKPKKVLKKKPKKG